MSPLNVLLNREGGAPKDVKIFHIIKRNAEQLYRLINQILDLSMLDAGQASLQATENDLTALLKNIVANFASFADERSINYEIRLPDEKVAIYFDSDKLEKVFVNILSNAFKFTAPYGKVSLRLVEYADEVIIQVTDNGKGINKEEQELIFNRFYKAEDSVASSGTGIGLSLCKQIVELHKGEISVESVPGLFTLFTIKLLKGKAHLSEEEIFEGKQFRQEEASVFLPKRLSQ